MADWDWLPKVYWSTAEIEAFLLQLEIAWSGFNDDMAKAPNALKADEKDQFEMLDEGYAKWKAGLNFYTRSSGGTITTAKRYAEQLKYWSDLLANRTGQKPTGPGLSMIIPEKGSNGVPLVSGSLFGSGPALVSDQTAEKFQTVVVAVCVAVGLSAIARTIRG